MKTEISRDIQRVCQLLEMGEAVAIPTETVYGLAANGLNPNAVRRIYEIKGRPSYNPLILHFSDKEKVFQATTRVPDWANELMDQFWPGPLTLVLPKAKNIPDVVTAGKQTVAVRVPSHPLMLEVLNHLDFPLAAPSANLFGRISPTRPEHVLKELNGRISLILDGGSCLYGVESTIIGVDTDDSPLLLRHGSIALEAIEAKIGRISKAIDPSDSPLAPGMLKSHYAPRTPAYLVGQLATWIEKLDHLKLGMLCFTTSERIDDPRIRVLSMSGNLEEAARELYRVMHELDHLKLDLLLFETFPQNGLGISINDKLQRATKPIVELRKFLKNEHRSLN